MAGDWIKIEENTPDKPEISIIASKTNLSVDAVVGKLVRVWAWASRNCHADGVTHVTAVSQINRAACHDGFTDGMIEAGWLIVTDEGLKFPKFDSHTSRTAKERAQAYSRKQKERRRLAEEKRLAELTKNESNNRKKNVTAVTQVSRSERDKNVTKETETETDNITSLSARAREDPELDLGGFKNEIMDREPASVVIPPCTQNEAEQFGAQTGIPGDLVTEWYERHDANDWRPYAGNPPMTTKSWKYDIKNFWKNKKAKDDERRTRNQRNGAETAGKVRINAANDRNNYVDQATLDAYARKDRIVEISDLIKLWVNTERWGSCTTLKEWYNDPLMPDIIEYIREKDEQLFNKISDLNFIDAESGRWTGPTRPTN